MDVQQATKLCVDGGVKPRRPVHPFCHPQKVDRENLWVGLLARKVATLIKIASGFTFPGSAEWCIEAACPRSQWRDRAGLTPVFPVMPLTGTQRQMRMLTRTEAISTR